MVNDNLQNAVLSPRQRQRELSIMRRLWMEKHYNIQREESNNKTKQDEKYSTTNTEITYTPQMLDQEAQNFDDFKQILSTIRFIDISLSQGEMLVMKLVEAIKEAQNQIKVINRAARAYRDLTIISERKTRIIEIFGRMKPQYDLLDELLECDSSEEEVLLSYNMFVEYMKELIKLGINMK